MREDCWPSGSLLSEEEVLLSTVSLWASCKMRGGVVEMSFVQTLLSLN